MASLSVAPRPHAGRCARADVALEAAAVLGLALLAALVRWPHLMTVPPFTDETEEALRAWRIAQGEARPLTNVVAYIGAFWNYVVAGAFALLGRDPAAPRLVSLLAGTLTVVATYALGRAQFGRAAGAVAALLLAANGAHVLVNSHVAWSNCATPLFTTVGAWLLVRALRAPGDDRAPRRLLGWGAAGLAWGLALQTHPTAAPVLAGALSYALARDRRLPLRPGAWAFACLLAVGYANVLLYNAQTGLGTLAEARRVADGYTDGPPWDLDRYLASLAGVAVLLVQALAGIVEPHPTVWGYLADPRFLPSALLAAAAVGWAARRGEGLALPVVLVALAVLPLLNQRWSPILAARYVMPVVPLVLVAIGGTIATLALRAVERRGRGGPIGAAAAALAVLAVGLLPLHAYYRAEGAAGRSNEGALAMVRVLEADRADREPVVVHADLHRLPTGGGGDWARTLTYLLAVRGIRRDVPPRDPEGRVRACDVARVELRHVRRARGERRGPDEPSAETYWLVRRAATPGEAPRDARGEVRLSVPYSLPWHNRSLFDPRVPTFETGCE